ncbi:tetratricopeptide repeat protein [Egbenema bharatensis]|uniref:tetratricopeptide repeat protein n=1 Tax=Egbenema bharatensis TaxID=3463334 RepID=UPI003A876849
MVRRNLLWVSFLKPTYDFSSALPIENPMVTKIKVFLSELKETINGINSFLLRGGFSDIVGQSINWLSTQFVNLIWKVNIRRNVLLFILAALIVRYAIGNFQINQLVQGQISTIFHLLTNGTFWNVLLYCIIAVFVFLTIKHLIHLKEIRLFFFAVLGFLVLKFWAQVIQNVAQVIQNVNELTRNTHDILSAFFNFPVRISTTINFVNILQLIAIILLGTLLYLFFRWLSSSGGIGIVPFDDSSLGTNEEAKLNGRTIADLLAVELHRIYHIHNFIEDGKLNLVQTSSSLLRVCREDLNLRLFRGEHLAKSLMQVGTIPITDKAALQVGSILIAIQQLWPSGSSQVITGSIHKYQSGNDLRLQIAARYEQSNHHTDIHAYEVGQDSANVEVSEMVKNLAYRIALDLSSSPILTSNWEAFKWLTEGMSHYYRYERTQSLEELNTAFDYCKRAKAKDKNYRKVGDLLALISFSYLNRDLNDRAKQAIDEAMAIHPASPYIQATYGNMYYLLGQYDEAFYHYNYAKELNPSRPEIYLRIGCTYLVAPPPYRNYGKARSNLWCTLNLELDNVAAQSALAWLDFLCHLKELEEGQYEKSEISLEKAFNKINRIPQDKKTYIDYSNLAIFYLYRGCEKKALDNWWKALQLCPSLASSLSIYDKLHYIFYKILSSLEFEQEIVDLQRIMMDSEFCYRRIIEDLLLDAKIILRKCLGFEPGEGSERVIFSLHGTLLDFQISERNNVSETHEKWTIAMKEFIAVLEYYLPTTAA